MSDNIKPIFDLDAYLNQMVDSPEALNLPGQVPRHQRLCWLLVANGGFTFRGWGSITSTPSGHQIGLELGDAIDLLQTAGWVTGLVMAGVDFDAVFMPYFERYIAQHGLKKGPAPEVNSANEQ